MTIVDASIWNVFNGAKDVLLDSLQKVQTRPSPLAYVFAAIASNRGAIHAQRTELSALSQKLSDSLSRLRPA